jgi:uncharacterized phage protein (TIGR01671 family)
MREILFRGKRKDNGEWIEGFYVCNRYSIGFAKEPAIYENHYIYTKRIDSEKWFKTIQVEVIHETVGQFTGLTDKNGKKIFEGDIVEITWKGNIICVGDIRYDEASCRFVIYENYIFPYGFDNTNTFEVIGNIHDNPELLKEQQNER